MIKNKNFKWKDISGNKNIKNHLATPFYKNIISAFTVNPYPIIWAILSLQFIPLCNMLES